MMESVSSSHRHVLLIVDDERATLESLSSVFKKDGYDIIPAKDAHEALDILRIQIPCLILLDVGMPGINGFELCRMLRKAPTTAHVPVAMVTGFTTEGDFERAVEAGASDYIRKPYDHGETRLRVRNLLLLHETYQRSEQLFDKTSQGIIAVSIATKKIVMANRAACKLLGHEEKELLAMSLYDIHPNNIAPDMMKGFDEYVRDERVSAFDIPCKRKDDTIVYTDISTCVICLKSEMCIVGFFTDVTERYQMEQELKQEQQQLKAMETELRLAQKMEAVGRLASGIAHEINTPTQFVGDNTRFLQDAFVDLMSVVKSHAALVEAAQAGAIQEDVIEKAAAMLQKADIDYLTGEIPKAFEQSLEGILRISSIVRAMKEFAHPGTDEKVHSDINRLIESTVVVSKNEWKYSAEMVLDLDDKIPLVFCLPGEINQVFLNLIVNAAQAISEAATQREKRQKGTITISTARKNGFVEIRIKDTGTGIPEDIRDKIMDPFFTTKEVGKGTGQGLAIARSCVVDKHNGKLFFETEEGKGTTFVIQLPIDEEAASGDNA